MELNNLKPAKGSVSSDKRIARGQGSGAGGTATRGHKGAKSRSGYSKKVGFEGGQMPLQRRVPKFGFKNPTRVEYTAVNVAMLQTLADKHGVSSLDFESFQKYGLASKNQLVKVLGNGEIKSNLEVKAHAFSKSAVAAIEAAGGKAIKL